eukprot:1922420-Prymnesium_polylepis.1
MFNSGGAVLSDTLQGGDGVCATVAARGPGNFVAFADPAPRSVSVDGKTVQFKHSAATGRLTFMLGGVSQTSTITVRWAASAA